MQDTSVLHTGIKYFFSSLLYYVEALYHICFHIFKMMRDLVTCFMFHVYGVRVHVVCTHVRCYILFIYLSIYPLNSFKILFSRYQFSCSSTDP